MSLKHLYSPAVCPLCESETAQVGLCNNKTCTDRLKPIDPSGHCRVCFTPLLQDGTCSFCVSRNVFFDSYRAIYSLDEHTAKLVRKLKFENDRWLIRLFVDAVTGIMSHHLTANGDVQKDVQKSAQQDSKSHLNPNPAHRSEVVKSNGSDRIEDRYSFIERIGWISSGRLSHQTRPYQPMADLVRAVAASLKIGYGGDIVKTKQGKQSAARYEGRFFDIPRSLRLTTSFHRVDYYLLLEDIFTTGATANESARLLKKAGVKEVHILSLFQRQRDGLLWIPSQEIEKETLTS